MLTPREKRQLDDLGYLVLPNFVPPPLLDELRDRVEKLWAEEGEEAGSEFRYEPGTRRLANLIDKGAIFAELVSMPRILDCIEHVIGPGYKLSSLNARSTNPQNGESQPWHVGERGQRDSARCRRVQDHAPEAAHRCPAREIRRRHQRAETGRGQQPSERVRPAAEDVLGVHRHQ